MKEVKKLYTSTRSDLMVEYARHFDNAENLTEEQRHLAFIMWQKLERLYKFTFACQEKKETIALGNSIKKVMEMDS